MVEIRNFELVMLLQINGNTICQNYAMNFIMFAAPRDLAEAAYLTATNSLILTDFCVKFSSERVACFCIYLACKWTGLIVSHSYEPFIRINSKQTNL